MHLKNILKNLTSRLTDYSSSEFKITGADQKAQIIQLSSQKSFQKMEIQKLKLIGGCTQKILTNH